MARGFLDIRIASPCRGRGGGRLSLTASPSQGTSYFLLLPIYTHSLSLSMDPRDGVTHCQKFIDSIIALTEAANRMNQ